MPTPTTRFRQLLAADPEAAERLLRVMEAPAETGRVTTPECVAEVVRPLVLGDTERLAVVALNRRHAVVDAAVVSIGNDCQTIVCPRAVLRWVLTRQKPCYAFALAHNHPSGDPTPSHQDREVTRRLRKAAETVGLTMLDHVVVTENDYRRVEV